MLRRRSRSIVLIAKFKQFQLDYGNSSETYALYIDNRTSKNSDRREKMVNQDLEIARSHDTSALVN